MAEKFELFDLIYSAYPNFRPWAVSDLRESYITIWKWIHISQF